MYAVDQEKDDVESNRGSLENVAKVYSIQHTAYNGTPGRLSPHWEWGWMGTMETSLAHITCTPSLTEEQQL